MQFAECEVIVNFLLLLAYIAVRQPSHNCLRLQQLTAAPPHQFIQLLKLTAQLPTHLTVPCRVQVLQQHRLKHVDGQETWWVFVSLSEICYTVLWLNVCCLWATHGYQAMSRYWQSADTVSDWWVEVKQYETRHIVTMKMNHLREIDIGISESVHKFDLG
jgi:hypothetical protein